MLPWWQVSFVVWSTGASQAIASGTHPDSARLPGTGGNSLSRHLNSTVSWDAAVELSWPAPVSGTTESMAGSSPPIRQPSRSLPARNCLHFLRGGLGPLRPAMRTIH